MKKNTKHYRIELIEDIIQLDLGQRGIKAIPAANLCTATRSHLYRAAQAIASKPGAAIGIVTGFYIPQGKPPAPETDGPIGSIALARGLIALGYRVSVVTDEFSVALLKKVHDFFSLSMEISTFPMDEGDETSATTADDSRSITSKTFCETFFNKHNLNFLISIERVGPCHSWDSVCKQHSANHGALNEKFLKHGAGALADQYVNMHAVAMNDYHANIHFLFEHIDEHELALTTIGIGDGGNEIGMGSIPWEVICDNILSGTGGKIACRIPTDFTIVAGVSNWGAYGLLASICILLEKEDLFLKLISEVSETLLMEYLIKENLAVDGVFGYPNMSVDGIDWEIHLIILKLIRHVLNLRGS